MNKFILFFTLSLPSLFIYSQPSEGLILLGGSISYTNPTTENADAQGNSNGLKSSTKNLTNALQGGYFLTNNFVLGITTNYVNNKTVIENIPSSKSTSDSRTWFYGLFGRTYTKVTEKLFFTNSFSISLRSGANNIINNFYRPDFTNSSSLDVKGYTLNYAAGFSYFLNHHIALNLAVGGLSYDHYNTTITSGIGTGLSSTNGLFIINLPLNNFAIGINFFIGRINTNEKKS